MTIDFITATNKITYFLTLCKTYPNGANDRREKENRYTINDKFMYNGFAVQLNLSIAITHKYIYQLKSIYINGKKSNMYDLARLAKQKYIPPMMSEIWY